MKRWGQIKGDVAWRDVAQQVYLTTDAAARMKDAGLGAAGQRLQVVHRDGQGVRSRHPRCLRRLIPDPADMKRRLRSGLLTLLILAVTLGAWQIAATPRQGPQTVDPEYAALVGAAASQGQKSPDAPPVRRRGAGVGAAARSVLHPWHQRPGHRHPVRLVLAAGPVGVWTGGAGGDPAGLRDRDEPAAEHRPRPDHPGAAADQARSPGCHWRSTPSRTAASRRSSSSSFAPSGPCC